MELKSFILIEKEDRYLLIAEKSAKWRGQWFFPGGNVDEHEDPATSVIREVKEEADCAVSVQGIIYFRFYKGLLNDSLHIYYVGTTGSFSEKKKADKHSLGSKWFTYDEIRTLSLRQHALEIIDAYRASKTLLPPGRFRLFETY
ncbi:MAG: NUDIX hydrolase [Bacteroidia bacterium]